MPQTKVRVVGSGFTTFQYDGDSIMFLDSVVDSGQQPISQGSGGGPGWEPITPLGSKHPKEIATGRVLGPGTLTATIRELWNEDIWASLSKDFANATTIVDVWKILANRPGPVTCKMVIRPPSGAGPNRRKVYHGCVVTSIDTGETVQIGTLSVAKTVQIAYTHVTTGGSGEPTP